MGDEGDAQKNRISVLHVAVLYWDVLHLSRVKDTADFGNVPF